MVHCGVLDWLGSSPELLPGIHGTRLGGGSLDFSGATTAPGTQDSIVPWIVLPNALEPDVAGPEHGFNPTSVGGIRGPAVGPGLHSSFLESTHLPLLEVLHGLHEFVAVVHHEGPMGCHGFLKGLAAQDQESRLCVGFDP